VKLLKPSQKQAFGCAANGATATAGQRRLRLRESDSQSRVADIILFLADGQGKKAEGGIEIPNLPHRELSSLSGLARETVTRVLSKLERKGLIARDRDTLRIPDIDALERMLMT
jgi:cAMP-binding proteins - catabolite gene activator and regulatory subunit of cAMP-dependent protein kinases